MSMTSIFLKYLAEHSQRPRLRWGERPWNPATTTVEEAEVQGCVIRRIETTVAWDTKQTLLVMSPDGAVVYRAVKVPYRGWVTVHTSPLAQALVRAQAETPIASVTPVPEPEVAHA
ncbi:MAG TPA: hypothetical protein G4O04_03750 [Anaerolineae bacterium]|nr:hypothetical protein [Anaerolineae bacterium]HID84111.1 hypothetical protein [Anaerolineales bacterium]HIQ08635.1 hypothetical protein [Anaerolineaceae bacterium]